MGIQRIIAKGGSRSGVFREAAKQRYADAMILAKKKHHLIGAVYLLGYALECLLKAAICEKMEEVMLPKKFEHHDLSALLADSGLQPALREQRGLSASFDEICLQWGPELRYRTKLPNSQKPDAFFARMCEFHKWLQKPH